MEAALEIAAEVDSDGGSESGGRGSRLGREGTEGKAQQENKYI